MKNPVCAISTIEDGVVVFPHKDVQHLWVQLHSEWFYGENPEEMPYAQRDGEHLVVDIVQPEGGSAQLRLLALYDEATRQFSTDEDDLRYAGMAYLLDADRDRFGQWTGHPDDEGVRYGRKLGQTCPTCKTTQRPIYDEAPNLGHYCDCTRGRWDDQVYD